MDIIWKAHVAAHRFSRAADRNLTDDELNVDNTMRKMLCNRGRKIGISVQQRIPPWIHMENPYRSKPVSPWLLMCASPMMNLTLNKHHRKSGELEDGK